MLKNHKQQNQIAKEISYAHSARSKGGRAVIKIMENMTGRISLLKRAQGYHQDILDGQSFWKVLVERYGLELDIIHGALSNIPKTGPLVLVSNHPYGILDGLMLGHILDQTRPDFRILAHAVFQKSHELNKVIMPISFDGDKEAVALNLRTRKTALNYLKNGGAIGIFPGGTVSTSAKPFSQPLDPSWRAFTARMILKSNPTVVPLYFEGHASRLFQLASHLHYTLRMGLLIKEFKSRVDSPVRVSIGQPLNSDEMAMRSHDPTTFMDYLRNKTYELSMNTDLGCQYGYEFEERYKS